MSLIVFAWDDDIGDFVEYPDRLRVDSLEVTIMAEECASGSSEVILEDATGDFYVRSYKPMYFRETEAQTDGLLGIIGPFWTGKRWIGRGDERTGSRRRWRIELRDINSLLSLRVQKGTDAERDAETDIERLEWLIGTAEVIGGHGDHGYTIEETSMIFDDDPVDMGETSYVGQYSEGVLNDLMQQSGANCYLYSAPTAGDPLRIGIWYGRTERTDFASIHKISDILSDVSAEARRNFEGDTPDIATPYVFPPSFDAELERDPSRQVTGALLQWDGGNTYDSLPILEPTWTRRDMSFAGELVKTSTQAAARLTRYLNDLQFEDDSIPCSVIVPAKLIHAFLPGHRIQYKSAYMPGYSSYVWMRAAKITYRQLGGGNNPPGGLYELAMDLRAETPPGPDSTTPPEPEPGVCDADDPTEAGTYGPNNSFTSAGTGNVHYGRAGWPTPIVAQPGHVGSGHFVVFGGGGSPDYMGDCTGTFVRFCVVGDGVATFSTAIWGAARTMTARLYHRIGVVDTLDSIQTGLPLGTDFDVTVSSHDGEVCEHWIDIIDSGGGCGSKYGFAGVTWTPA